MQMLFRRPPANTVAGRYGLRVGRCLDRLGTKHVCNDLGYGTLYWKETPEPAEYMVVNLVFYPARFATWCHFLVHQQDWWIGDQSSKVGMESQDYFKPATNKQQQHWGINDKIGLDHSRYSRQSFRMETYELLKSMTTKGCSRPLSSQIVPEGIGSTKQSQTVTISQVLQVWQLIIQL